MNWTLFNRTYALTLLAVLVGYMGFLCSTKGMDPKDAAALAGIAAAPITAYVAIKGKGGEK